MTLRSVLLSMVATVVAFSASFLMLAGNEASPTLAAANIVEETQVDVVVPVETVAPVEVVAPVETTTAPDVTTVPTTAAPVKAAPAPTLAPPVVVAAPTTVVAPVTKNFAAKLTGVSNSEATGNATVRFVESSNGTVATIKADVANLADGSYGAQIAWTAKGMKTGWTVCLFNVSDGAGTGGCSGEYEQIPAGATLTKVVINTLNTGGGGAVAEGALARS